MGEGRGGHLQTWTQEELNLANGFKMDHEDPA